MFASSQEIFLVVFTNTLNKAVLYTSWNNKCTPTAPITNNMYKGVTIMNKVLVC
jgi:hypothetical protein